MKKKVLSIFLALVMILCFIPTSVFAAGTQNAVPDLTVNSTKVNFAGYEWWVIGYNGKGVYSTTGDNRVTLLAVNGSSIFGKCHFDDLSTSYAGSTLQKAMENIPKNKNFPEKEQNLISARNLTVAEDNITGSDISDQKLWALSRDEALKINSHTILPIGETWWLRQYYTGNNIYSVGGNPGNYSIFGTIKNNNMAIRPALSLDLSSALFAFDATTDTNKNSIGKDSATVSGNLIATSSSSTGNVKFTMKDSSQSITISATQDQAKQSGTSLIFSYTDATVGSNKYVSCIMIDASGSVKYYGKLASCETNSYGTIKVPLEGVAAGTYTLQIFLEEINDNALYTDFCSEPVSMSVIVNDEGTGTVSNYDGNITIIPKLKIDSTNKNWYVSYDDGQTWASLGIKATGEDGEDAITPHIGSDGYWYLGTTNTNIKAQGETGDTGVKGDKGDTGATGQDGKDGIDGKDGVDGKDGIGIKKAEINTDGELVITYTDETVSNLGVVVGENGKDGLTPFIGDNGNWWIGETDTGVKAATDNNNATHMILGGVAGLSLLSNICLIIYVLKKKKS